MNIRVLLNPHLPAVAGFFFFSILHFPCSGQPFEPSSKEKKPDFIITSRLHSTGHFPYTGSFINHHLSMDLNLFYQRNNVGAFLFKSQDLEDAKSIVNYLQPGVFKTFPAGKKVEMRVMGGYLFSQTCGFSDKDSDVWSALNTAWTINKIFKVENTSLFLNLTKTELHRQLANRVVVSAVVNDFKLDLYLWHNVVFETKSQFTSGALAINLPGIRLSDIVKIQNVFTYQTYITSSRPSYAMKNGFLFSILVPVQVSRAE